MKAVIMAGGTGIRLQPATLDRPKVMIPLFGKPVMEHMIEALKKHGITEICVTVGHMSQFVTTWFGDGTQFGVQLHYFIEQEPMGTAGSVKQCMSVLGEDDFLVVSGDTVCGLDLSAAIGLHRVKRADATLVLVCHSTPLEYGMVLLREDGQVEQFVEKPSWGQVMSSTISTGVYVLTRAAMDRVPDRTHFDFGQDLFPLLLRTGVPLYGHVDEGYWCDIGSSASYLACATDALSRKTGLDLELPELLPGIWSAVPLPASVTVVPPCWIGANTSIGEGTLLGPYVVLEEGAHVGRRSLIQRSILMEGANLSDGVTLCGSILCRDTQVAAGAVLNEGTVLGAGSRVGEHAILMEQVKIWPNQSVVEGARLSRPLVDSDSLGYLTFGDGGVIRGTYQQDISAELLMTIGGILGAERDVGLGWSGGNAAQLLARSAGCGIVAAGGNAQVHDGNCAAMAAWVASQYDLPVSMFVEQEEQNIYLHFFDRHGLSLNRSRERKLECALLRGELRRTHGERVGKWTPLVGIPDSYIKNAVNRSRLASTAITPLAVAVSGIQAADQQLAKALEELGCIVLRRHVAGVPCFETGYGGLRLTAWDEDGRVLSGDELLMLVCLVELEHGGGQVAVPASAPAAIDRLTERGRVLRLGQDGKEAKELYQTLPWLRDATFAALRLCARLGQTGERLTSLAGKAPHFVRVRQELPLHLGRGALMQQFAQEGERLEDGIRISVDGAWVYLSALSRRAALRVVTEATNMETAQALCAHYIQRARTLDVNE